MADQPKYIVRYKDGSEFRMRLLTEDQLLTFLREITQEGGSSIIRNPNWTITYLEIRKQ